MQTVTSHIIFTNALGKAMRIIALCLALGMIPAGMVPARGEVFDQNQVKAVFLYNLTHFITWPDNPDPEPPSAFVIGILSPDHFNSALEAAARGEHKNGRAIAIHQFSSLDEIHQQACDLLFINGEMLRIWPQIRAIARARGILTVSDTKGFGGRGGMVNLLASARKINIEINIQEAKRNGFIISAKLLEVARIVTGGKDK